MFEDLCYSVTGMSMTVMDRKDRLKKEAPLDWERMTRPERRLYVQAENEYGNGTVSRKILRQAQEGAASEEELEQRYVILRYRQLWSQCAAQQRKIAERHSRDRIITTVAQEPAARAASAVSGKHVTVWTLSVLGFLVLVAATWYGILQYFG